MQIGVSMTKVAVLVSGGIDSTVAYVLAVEKFGSSNVTPVYVKCGQPYMEKELEALRKLGIAKVTTFIETLLCEYILDNVPTVDRQEITGRNLLMTFYGAFFGERVWLAALENELYESVPDKEYEFFHMASALYTRVFKGRQRNTVVESPLETMSKSDVVKLAKSFPFSVFAGDIKDTISCYDPRYNVHSCGDCLACFKRWIAFVNNDIQEDYQINKKPWTSAYARKVIREIRAKNPHYSEKRIEETRQALAKVDIEL